MDEKSIGAWVRSARNHKGWTQDQLSEQLGMTKANVSHWETGKHEPGFMQILKVRDLTGYPLRDVQPAATWPFKSIRRDQITSLDDDQLSRLETGITGILASLGPGSKKQRAA